MKNEKFTATLWILLCYAVALAGAWLTVKYVPIEDVIWRTFVADVVATFIVFLFSTVFKNASFYDAYWSVAPIPIAIYWKFHYGGEHWDNGEIIVLAIITWWSLRLTANWYRGWEGLHHEDWRYTDLRNKTGVFFPLVNFFGIHLFPTAMVFLGCLPLVAISREIPIEPSLPMGLIILIFLTGTIIGFVAPIIQFFADEQMRAHRKNPGRGYIDVGLWRYSRHPNYFGEILFWFAIFLIGFSYENFEWWMASGVAAMIFLFVFISSPLMEKRILGKYPDYKEQQRRVSMIVPWWRGR